MFAPASLRVKSWLLGLAFSASVPLVGFSAFTVLELAQARQESMRQELAHHAETAAGAVGKRLDSVAMALSVMAQTDAALTENHAALHQLAVRFQSANPSIQAVILDDLSGQQIFNSFRPFGTPLPKSGATQTNERVIQTGQPAISPIFFGSITRQSMSSLSIPVRINGQIRYFLRAILQPETLNPILQDLRLPQGWRAAIIDRNCTYVARSHDAEVHVGTPLPQSICNAISWGEVDIFDTPNREGIPSQAFLSKVPNWDWQAVVAVPNVIYQGPYQKFLLAVMVGGITLLVCGAVLSHWLAYYISSRVNHVVQSAGRLCRGEEPEAAVTHIHELDELNQALGVASHDKQRTEQVLTQARRDPLTDLPGRALFLELCHAAHHNHTNHTHHMTIMFVDLDGFKQVNDRHGHARGDDVLIQAANILRRVLRDSDIAGRLGGDEFVVCLQTTPDTNVTAIAGRIIDQISAIGDGIGCSVGIAHWPLRCQDLNCAIMRADEAMYEAKHRGKGQWATYGQPKTDGTEWKNHQDRHCWSVCRQITEALQPG